MFVCIGCVVAPLSKVMKKNDLSNFRFPPAVRKTNPGLSLRGTSLIEDSPPPLLQWREVSWCERSTPPRATKPHPCPRPAPPRSPQVEGQGHGEDDPGQHEERQPGLQEGPAAGGRRRDTAVSDAPDRKYKGVQKKLDIISQDSHFGNSC